LSVAKPPRAAPGLAARGGTAAVSRHKGAVSEPPPHAPRARLCRARVQSRAALSDRPVSEARAPPPPRHVRSRSKAASAAPRSGAASATPRSGAASARRLPPSRATTPPVAGAVLLPPTLTGEPFRPTAPPPRPSPASSSSPPRPPPAGSPRSRASSSTRSAGTSAGARPSSPTSPSSAAWPPPPPPLVLPLVSRSHPCHSKPQPTSSANAGRATPSAPARAAPFFVEPRQPAAVVLRARALQCHLLPPLEQHRATLVTVLHADNLPWGCCCHDSRASDKRQPLKPFFSSEPLLSGEDSLHFPPPAGEQLLASFYYDWSRAAESSMPSTTREGSS
jgi:hypothetical protein